MSTDYNYWEETQTPFSSLVFLLPILILYEVGVITLGGAHADLYRNGADYWMRDWLAFAGWTQRLILPCLVISLLFIWHLNTNNAWNVHWITFQGMIGESIIYALGLMLLDRLLHIVISALPVATIPALSFQQQMPSIVAFLGAGIYEEFLFRLCLLPVLFGLFRAGGMTRGASIACSILISSLFFSLAHYIGRAGDPFEISSFLFRTVAGIFFSVLFFFRGFGITVGTHASYNLLVGVILASR